VQGKDAVELIRLLEHHGIQVYVDGGWAVDALLGHQTRVHNDLDIAIPHRYVLRLREILGSRGYRERNGPDNWECNFVLVDESGHELDVHSYELDEQGNNVYGVEYRREHLTGEGVIDGHPVRCICAEWLVKFHSGYQLDENDYRDVKAVCERFGIPLPDEFGRFRP
jgi:lincosamide nucleotidyltransferase A/C/D/E